TAARRCPVSMSRRSVMAIFGGFPLRTMVSASSLSIRSKSLESLPAFIRRPTIQVPAWASLSASGSLSEQAAGSGLNLSPNEVQRFSLPSRRNSETEQYPSDRRPQVFLVEDNAADI